MHSVEILVELAIGLAVTGLISRLLFIVLASWSGGFAKPLAIHGWSFCLSGMLFVIWCSTPESTNWFAAHKMFMPQVAWFIFDCLKMTGQHLAIEDDSTADPGNRY
jgi:hypothetical protein